MFAALRRDWELSQSRRDSPAVPLAGPRPNALKSCTLLEEKLRTRCIRAPKKLVGARLHEPLANCARFHLDISYKYLNHRQLTPSPWRAHHAPGGHIPRSPPLPHHFRSLIARRFELAAREANLNNQPPGPKRSNPRQLATSPDSCTEPKNQC